MFRLTVGIGVTEYDNSTGPHQTNVLLIDFNNAERLDRNQELQYKRTMRTVSCLLYL